MAHNLRLQEPSPVRGGLADNVTGLDGVEVAQWREGVVVPSQCSVEGFIWQCGRSEGDPKPTNALADGDVFNPTILGNAATCNVGGSRSLIGNRQRQIAEQGLGRIQWTQIADLLYTGLTGYGAAGDENENPSFFELATIPEGQSYENPSTIEETMAGMLDTHCARWDPEVVFHVPQQFLPVFVQRQIVQLGADGVYRAGHHRVSFDCYQNLGPEAADDDREPPENGSAFWMYLSSVPRVEMDRVIVVDALEARQNTYTAVAERGAIAVFDTCSVVAAMARVLPGVPLA